MYTCLFIFALFFGCSHSNLISFNVADVEISAGRFEEQSIQDAAEVIRAHYDRLNKNPQANFRRRRETDGQKPAEPVSQLEFETGNVNSQMANLRLGSGFNESTWLGTPIKHGFLAAAITAYNLHLPLELSADDFWLLVAFSMSQHLGQESVAEAYRDQFVNHTGKKELVVVVEQYGIAPHGNLEINKAQWPNAIRDMMDQIIINTDTDFASIMTDRFSTSSITELTAFRVALMESMKNYFEFTFGILCGIPEITLRGTVEDYEDLVERIDGLIELFQDFNWYLGRIREHAQKLLETAQGNPDVAHWKNFVKVQTPGGCGPPETFISGWMSDWIAYYSEPDRRGVETMQKVKPYVGNERNTINADKLDYPAVTLTEVKLKDFTQGQQFPMIFSGGFLGVSQNGETGALRPAIGWVTFYKGDPESVEEIDTSVEMIEE